MDRRGARFSNRHCTCRQGSEEREVCARVGSVPEHTADVDVLPWLVVGEHVGLQSRTHPVSPVRDGCLVCVEEHGITLCDGYNDTRY